MHHPTKDPTTHIRQRCNTYTRICLGSSRFARRYWGNRSFFLFLQILRCFSSLRSPLQTYEFSLGWQHLSHCRVSPFRNLRVTVRLTTRRSLSQSSTSFIASQRQGIHRCALYSLISIPRLQSINSKCGFWLSLVLTRSLERSYSDTWCFEWILNQSEISRFQISQRPNSFALLLAFFSSVFNCHPDESFVHPIGEAGLYAVWITPSIYFFSFFYFIADSRINIGVHCRFFFRLPFFCKDVPWNVSTKIVVISNIHAIIRNKIKKIKK